MRRNSRMDMHFMTYPPTDPRNEYMRARQWHKLNTTRSKRKSNLIVLSIHPRALWSEEVRICPSNGFLLMDKVLSPKHIEAIYELEYDGTTKQWMH